MNDPVRVAVVGVGDFGVLHAETLARLTEARLVALVDSDIGRAQTVCSKVGGPLTFSNMAELITSQAAEAVVIATRVESHLSLAMQAASAGLHVLVEKPLAHGTDEIRQFQQWLKARPVVVMVDHSCLFHSLIVPLRERLRKTGFRALHFVRHRTERIGARFPQDHPIQLVMVHDLYVAAQLVNGEEPIAFHAMESCNAAGRTDMSWAALRWADGRTATFQCHMMLPEGSPAEGWDSLEVFGDGLHSKVTTNPAPWTWTQGQPTWPVNLEIRAEGGMLAGLLRNFLVASRGGSVAGGCTVADALQVQNWIERLLNAARKS